MDLHTAAPVHTQRMSLGNISAPEPRILDRRQATPLCTSAISQERIQRRKKLSCERTLLLASESLLPWSAWELSAEACSNGPIATARPLRHSSARCHTDRPGGTAGLKRWRRLRCNGSYGMPANGQLCVTALAVAPSFMRAFWPGIRQGRPRARAFHCAAAVVTRSERAMTSIASPGSKSASSDAGRRSHPSPLLRMIVTAGRTPLLAASTDAIRP